MSDPALRLNGHVVYLYAFDVAYDMKREPVSQLLGRPVQTLAIETDKRGPREQFFYRPQMIRLPPQAAFLLGKQVLIERTVKLFAVGAVSLSFKVPVTDEPIERLVEFHDPLIEGRPLSQHARSLAEEIRRELAPFYVHPIEQLREDEAYTVFCLDSASLLAVAPGATAEAWLDGNRSQIAAILMQESDAARLSQQEITDTAGRYISYYVRDLVIVDWDAALIIDDPGQFDPMLHIIELANVQLAELEAYDRLLDEKMQRAYRDMARPRLFARAEALKALRELRIDLARLSDELSNTTKFFGDWHLARVYHAVSNRFHLADWHRTVDDKIKTLDELYQLLKQDQLNRWMMFLEVAVVVLFLIEVFQLFLKG